MKKIFAILFCGLRASSFRLMDDLDLDFNPRSVDAALSELPPPLAEANTYHVPEISMMSFSQISVPLDNGELNPFPMFWSVLISCACTDYVCDETTKSPWKRAKVSEVSNSFREKHDQKVFCDISDGSLGPLEIKLTAEDDMHYNGAYVIHNHESLPPSFIPCVCCQREQIMLPSSCPSSLYSFNLPRPMISSSSTSMHKRMCMPPMVNMSEIPLGTPVPCLSSSSNFGVCPSCKCANELTASFGHAAVSLLVLAHPSVKDIFCSGGLGSHIDAVCFKVCMRCYTRMNRTLKHARQKYPQFQALIGAGPSRRKASHAKIIQIPFSIGDSTLVS